MGDEEKGLRAAWKREKAKLTSKQREIREKAKALYKKSKKPLQEKYASKTPDELWRRREKLEAKERDLWEKLSALTVALRAVHLDLENRRAHLAQTLAVAAGLAPHQETAGGGVVAQADVEEGDEQSLVAAAYERLVEYKQKLKELKHKRSPKEEAAYKAARAEYKKEKELLKEEEWTARTIEELQAKADELKAAIAKKKRKLDEIADELRVINSILPRSLTENSPLLEEVP